MDVLEDEHDSSVTLCFEPEYTHPTAAAVMKSYVPCAVAGAEACW